MLNLNVNICSSITITYSSNKIVFIRLRFLRPRVSALASHALRRLFLYRLLPSIPNIHLVPRRIIGPHVREIPSFPQLLVKKVRYDHVVAELPPAQIPLALLSRLQPRELDEAAAQAWAHADRVVILRVVITSSTAISFVTTTRSADPSQLSPQPRPVAG